MTRFMEGIFVIGCALVGFGMNAPEGSGIRDTVKCSVQLIAVAQDNVTVNAAQLGAHLALARAEMIAGLLK
jgi:hypothetical protein